MNQTTVDIMVATLADATVKQYESPLHQWQVFTGRFSRNFINPERNSALGFLMGCFNVTTPYGMLNSHRSAIFLISSHNLKEDKVIARFMKGLFELKLARSKHVYAWDTSIVRLYTIYKSFIR